MSIWSKITIGLVSVAIIFSGFVIVDAVTNVEFVNWDWNEDYIVPIDDTTIIRAPAGIHASSTSLFEDIMAFGNATVTKNFSAANDNFSFVEGSVFDATIDDGVDTSYINIRPALVDIESTGTMFLEGDVALNFLSPIFKFWDFDGSGAAIQDFGNISGSKTFSYPNITGNVVIDSAYNIFTGENVFNTASTTFTGDVNIGGNATTSGSFYVGNTLWNGTKNLTEYNKFFDGTTIHAFDALVQSDGTTASTTVERAGGGDITVRFSTGDSNLDCAPTKCVIQITPGDDDAPQKNYIYVLESDPTNLAISTSDWPSAEHVKITFLFCPSIAEIQSEGGCYINQNWNDFAFNTNMEGGWATASECFRYGLGYFSGLDPNGVDQDTNASYFNSISATEAYYKASSGSMCQKNMHAMPAVDSQQATDDMHVINSSVVAYREISDFTDITLDSLGGSFSNKYWAVCMFEIGNKTSQYNPTMIKLPKGSYTKQTDAENDIQGFDDCALPREFVHDAGVGIPVVRMVLRYTGGFGTLSHISSRDLREAGNGSGATGVGVTTFPGLTDTPASYSGEALNILQVNAGETALEFTGSPTFDNLAVTDTITVENLILVTGTTTNWTVLGNATTTGWFNVGTTDVVGTLGSLIGAGDLFVGNNATVTNTLSVTTIEVNNDYITDFTGTNLSVTNGVLNASGGGGGGAWEKYTVLASPVEIITPTTTNASIYVSGNATITNHFTADVTLYVKDSKVGIGTASPNTKLTVDTSVGQSQVITDSDIFGMNVFGYHNNGLLVHTGFNDGIDIARFSSIGGGFIEVPRMVIKDSGNVGIGTADPDRQLTLANTGDAFIKLYGDTDNNDSVSDVMIEFFDGTVGGGNARGHVGYDRGLNVFTMGYGGVGSDHLVIDGNGNVGIGTASPGTLLHLQKADTVTLTVEDTSTNGVAGINLKNDAQEWLTRIASDDSYQIIDVTNSSAIPVRILSSAPNLSIDLRSNEIVLNQAGVDLDLRVEASGHANALFVQGSSGKVGIGTSNPGELLHVAGSTKLGGITTIDGNVFILNSRSFVVGNNQSVPFESGLIPTFQVLGTFPSDTVMGFGRWSNNAFGPRLLFLKGRGAVIGGGTIVQNGDMLGEITFKGTDNSGFPEDAAMILGEVDGTPGVGDMPGRLIFSTTPDGSGTVVERMRIDSAGVVDIAGDVIVGGVLDLDASSDSQFTSIVDTACSTQCGTDACLSAFTVSGVGIWAPVACSNATADRCFCSN